jgi:hypothetical protein
MPRYDNDDDDDESRRVIPDGGSVYVPMLHGRGGALGRAPEKQPRAGGVSSPSARGR